jgi:hypothetical protein
MSRSTHRLGQEKCNECCFNTKPFSGTNGEVVDTNINIVTYTTSSSCCFEIFSTTLLYDPGIPIPSPFFFTNPAVPNAAMFATALNSGAIFSFTSFKVTNLYTGDFTEYIPSGLLQISVGHPGLAPALPGIIGADIPEITLSGNFAFGSFDKVLAQVFQLIDRNGGGFQSLTNPNELELGKSNVTQIIWPIFYTWSLTWINFDNNQITLSASHTAVDANNSVYGTFTCTTTTLNLSLPNPQPVTTTQMCSTAWDVPCHPTGYVTQRQSFDFNFPCVAGPGCIVPRNPGCTGATGAGVFCIDSFIIDNRTISFPPDCVCAQFTDDTLVDQPNNQGKLVKALNTLFKTSKVHGWKAISDIEYGYIRIVYPDNILSWSIKINKTFYNSAGAVLPLCMQTMTFKQGAKTEKAQINVGGTIVTTANNPCILNRLCWVMESDKNGFFLTR